MVHLEWDLLNSSRLWVVTWNALYYTEDLGDTFVGVVNAAGTPATPHITQLTPIDAKPFVQMRLPNNGRVVLFGRPCLGLWWSFTGEAGSFDFQFPFPAVESFENDECIGTLAADNVTRRVYVTTQASAGSTRVLRSCEWSDGLPCLDWTWLRRCEDATEAACRCETSFDCELFDERASSLTVSLIGRPIMAIATTRPGAPGRPTDHFHLGDDDIWRPDYRNQDGLQTQPRHLQVVGGSLFEGNRDAWWSLEPGGPWRKLSDEDVHHVDHRALYPDLGLGRVWSVTDGEGNGGDGDLANIVRWTWSRGHRPTDAVRVNVRGIRAIQSYFIGVVPSTATTVRRFPCVPRSVRHRPPPQIL